MNENKAVNLKLTVSDIVRQDYRMADVFKKWGINYCCGGNLSVAEACAFKDVSLTEVQTDLAAASRNQFGVSGPDYDSWPVDFLIDYIVHVHHSYLKRVLPSLSAQIHSFVTGHKSKYPYLQDVEDVFNDLATELIEHNQSEEDSVFPYLKQITSTYKRKETYGSLFVRTLGKPMDQKLAMDHKRIMALVTQLRKVTDNYSFSDEACTNHQVLYHKLKELDNDLVQHKHLENNILLPKVLQMEKELLQV